MSWTVSTSVPNRVARAVKYKSSRLLQCNCYIDYGLCRHTSPKMVPMPPNNVIKNDLA